MFNLSLHPNMERKFILLQSHMFNLSLQASALNIYSYITYKWWLVAMIGVCATCCPTAKRVVNPDATTRVFSPPKMSLTGILGIPWTQRSRNERKRRKKGIETGYQRKLTPNRLAKTRLASFDFHFFDIPTQSRPTCNKLAHFKQFHNWCCLACRHDWTGCDIFCRVDRCFTLVWTFMAMYIPHRAVVRNQNNTSARECIRKCAGMRAHEK